MIRRKTIVRGLILVTVIAVTLTAVPADAGRRRLCRLRLFHRRHVCRTVERQTAPSETRSTLCLTEVIATIYNPFDMSCLMSLYQAENCDTGYLYVHTDACDKPTGHCPNCAGPVPISETVPWGESTGVDCAGTRGCLRLPHRTFTVAPGLFSKPVPYDAEIEYTEGYQGTGTAKVVNIEGRPRSFMIRRICRTGGTEFICGIALEIGQITQDPFVGTVTPLGDHTYKLTEMIQGVPRHYLLFTGSGKKPKLPGPKNK